MAWASADGFGSDPIVIGLHGIGSVDYLSIQEAEDLLRELQEAIERAKYQEQLQNH